MYKGNKFIKMTIKSVKMKTSKIRFFISFSCPKDHSTQKKVPRSKGVTCSPFTHRQSDCQGHLLIIMIIIMYSIYISFHLFNALYTLLPWQTLWPFHRSFSTSFDVMPRIQTHDPWILSVASCALHHRKLSGFRNFSFNISSGISPKRDQETKE